MSNYDFAYRTGRIARGHGLRGEVLVQFFRKRDLALEPSRLKWKRLSPPFAAELEYQDEQTETVTITHVRWLDPIRVVLRIEESQNRNDADRCTGAYFDVDPGFLIPELHDDVDACFEARVIDAESEQNVGQVQRISDNGAQALLDVELIDGGWALIPFVEAIVEAVGEDELGRYVKVRPMPGLLEANK